VYFWISLTGDQCSEQSKIGMHRVVPADHITCEVPILTTKYIVTI
jgi:hypothetical protein